MKAVYKPVPGDVFIRKSNMIGFPYKTVRQGELGMEYHLSYWNDFQEAFQSAERVANGCAVIDEIEEVV